MPAIQFGKCTRKTLCPTKINLGAWFPNWPCLPWCIKIVVKMIPYHNIRVNILQVFIFYGISMNKPFCIRSVDTKLMMSLFPKRLLFTQARILSLFGLLWIKWRNSLHEHNKKMITTQISQYLYFLSFWFWVAHLSLNWKWSQTEF